MVFMSLAEGLSVCKSLRNRTVSLYGRVVSVAKEEAPRSREGVIVTKEEVAVFNQHKKERIEKLLAEAVIIKGYYQGLKEVVHRKNGEVGVDSLLFRKDMVLIELSKLQPLVALKRYSYEDGLQDEMIDFLGLRQRINELEAEKNKIISRLHHLNQETKIVVDDEKFEEFLKKERMV